MTPAVFVGSLVLAAVVGVAIGLAWKRRPAEAAGPASLPADVEHLMDLVRRAHQGRLACLVGPDDPPVVVAGDPMATQARIDRAVAVAKLAMEDGRERVMRGEASDEPSIVAMGDLSLGAAIGFDSAASEQAVAEVVTDLRRMLASVRAGIIRGTASDLLGWGRAGVPTGMDTLPAVSSGLCDQAWALTGRAAAVVARDRTTESASIVAVSQAADRRLLRQSVDPNSAAGRACIGDVPVIARSGDDLLGHLRLPGDRRRSHQEGTAYPLRDGRVTVGALLILGPREGLSAGVWENVMRLAGEAGPRFAAAAAVREAEGRALTDPLTGLPNRTRLEQAMANVVPGPCSVLCVDIDDFKKINDSFGHAAGDSALKHLARVFRDALREEDIPARIGGEEFVLWLPGAGQKVAVDVAERVRLMVGGARWEWAGAEIELSVSIGVASRPETTTEVANLLAAGDAALYRAKKSGRNRVEVATPTH